MLFYRFLDVVAIKSLIVFTFCSVKYQFLDVVAVTSLTNGHHVSVVTQVLDVVGWNISSFRLVRLLVRKCGHFGWKLPYLIHILQVAIVENPLNGFQ